jgi:hypothetical protein
LLECQYLQLEIKYLEAKLQSQKKMVLLLPVWCFPAPEVIGMLNMQSYHFRVGKTRAILDWMLNVQSVL